MIEIINIVAVVVAVVVVVVVLVYTKLGAVYKNVIAMSIYLLTIKKVSKSEICTRHLNTIIM